jgi:putative ABC transport system substrate-binding protein
MKRREFITRSSTVLLVPAVSWPLMASAQSERVRRIGVIMGFSAEDEVWQAYLATFRGRLEELGWTPGRNLKIDYRFVGDSAERTRAAAEELVALGPDVIFVSTNPVVTAVSRATHTIPVVFTGFHNYEPALGGKWLEVLKEVAPSVRRVGVVHVPEIAANVAFIKVAQAASASLGVTVTAAGVRDAANIDGVFSDFAREPNGGLIVTPSPLTATRRDVIIAAAARLKLPAIYTFRFYAASGGLISYGIDQLETVREAASYVDRILRGANPGDLPVQLPTKYQLVVNLKTAKALGLAVPESFLQRADEVIE